MTTTATAIYKYTYTLGRSLYIPLTCRCNSIPLPVTRGPKFVLPREVADALMNVRNAEFPGHGFGHADDGGGEGDDDRERLPPFPKKWLVNDLYADINPPPRQSQKHDSITADIIDDSIQPSISTLINEVHSRLSSDPFDQLVIAGEGEPTLRMDALLAVARTVQSRKVPVRVITNGLCYGVNNLGYSPYNRERNGVLPIHRHTVLRDMLEAGVTRVSVALNTANRHEYDLLMEPATNLQPGTAHDIVCEFIMEAAKVGMDVEITAIDRPDVDKRETDRLARMLLSVGDQKKKISNVRWRRYFE
jgi:hypothetical protein|mmetsp:Transcript_18970/g.41055  ORF Transcript_18970/g.41055 Transcript_18970/m.41055 type:complete len:304 (-) Transcript_18970:1495-2406(-)